MNAFLFIQAISYCFVIVQFLYNTACYNMIIYDVTPNSFYHGFYKGILGKMTILWSYSYNSFVKLSLYKKFYL